MTDGDTIKLTIVPNLALALPHARASLNVTAPFETVMQRWCQRYGFDLSEIVFEVI